MSKIYLLSESVYDFKYKSILGDIENFEVIEGNYFSLLKYMIKNRSMCCYHIRYVKYKSLLSCILRLLLISFICKLSSNKLLWSCHNIYEHNISSKICNDIVRWFLLLLSNHIIVFHQDIKIALPIFFSKKVSVCNFGDFKPFMEEKTLENYDFQLKYNNWLLKCGIDKPDILSISTAKKNRLDLLISGVQKSCIKCLIIAPGVELNLQNLKNNTFFYNNSSVEIEVLNLLNKNKHFIGFIGHDNYSVATSLYMFASFGIPVISTNTKPISSIVNENEIGIVVDNSLQIEEAYQKILNNYSLFSFNCYKFIQTNNWSTSTYKHKRIISRMFN